MIIASMATYENAYNGEQTHEYYTTIKTKIHNLIV